MKYSNRNIEAFFLLVRVGLFGRTEGAKSILLDDVDWNEVHRLAREQSVTGLLAEGIETLQRQPESADLGARITQMMPEDWAFQLATEMMYLEQSNQAMNKFVASLTGKLRKRGIDAVLLKGQGVAQYYEKPLWRTCGDIDLLLSSDNFVKAKDFLLHYASSAGTENPYKKHFDMSISRWTVELHGSLRCGFSARVDRELDNIFDNTFHDGHVTTWMDRTVPVYMLGRENNVLYVFAHFLNHFYKKGVGIRQICDWSRLLWSFRDTIDTAVLGTRLKSMGLMSEWRAFGAYAVEYLGMPEEAIPFYADKERWKRKARRIQQFILKTGNMGHNRKKTTEHVSLLTRKLKSGRQRLCDLTNHLMIFPLDTVRFMPSIFLNGLRQK